MNESPRAAFFVLVIVLMMGGGGICQLARVFPDAGRGLAIYVRDQKDMFIDAGLIRESYHVLSASALSAKLRSQTVIVAAQTSPFSAYMGAGVILGRRDGEVEILTAKHIVAHAGRKIVIFPDHSIAFARRIIRAAHDDLALVFVVPTAFATYPSAHLAAQTFASGEHFVVMGHPGAMSWTASPGIAERHIYGTLLFCPTCGKGDSGGGAFDGNGALHGIVVSKAIIEAPSARTGRYMKLTAFEMEPSKVIRAFLRTVR